MEKAPFKPFVPADSDLREFSIKALVLGVIGLRTDLDLSNPQVFGTEIWLKGAWGIRL